MDAHNFKLFLWSLFFACNIHACNAHDEFIDVIAKSKPAVVSIDVSRNRKSIKSQSTLDALGDHADFFSDDLEAQPRKSRGSGFIVNLGKSESSSIYILTAAHVVRGASKVTVTLIDAKRTKAEVVWLSRKNDVALLKLDLKNNTSYYSLELGSKAAVEGQSVLAIAGSFDLSISSSLGIISAVNVSLSSKKKLKLIQTDAAINPGSSGGPLIDSQGKVIGLISNIYSKTGSYSGAAFAIPSTLIKQLIVNKNKKIVL